MKFFAYFFAVYILLLSIVPCSDNNKDVSFSESKNDSHLVKHQHENEDEDTCSPFCTCACCGISVISFELKPISIQSPTEFYLVKVLPFRSYSFVSIYCQNIWQPPKTSA